MNGFTRTIIVAAALLCPSGLFAQSLKPGDPAPVLKPAKWIKGEPITSFAKGTVYVVEFWATWCGPCRENIPHLTDIAKKYEGRVAVVGVDIGEKPYDLGKVAAFVGKMGDKMAYRVCADDAQGTMRKTWLDAAGLGNIPASFIVDQHGEFVAYCIGRTDTSALDQVLAGTFDVQAFTREKRREAEDMGSMTAIEALVDKRDFKGALALTERTHFYTGAWMPMVKFYELVATEHIDEDKALAFARDWQASALAQRSGNDLRLLGLALTYSLDLPKRSAAYAIEVYRCMLANLKDYEPNFVLDRLASAYSLVGKKEEAIKTEQKAVDYTKGPNGDPSDVAYFAGNLKKLEAGEVLGG